MISSKLTKIGYTVTTNLQESPSQAHHINIQPSINRFLKLTIKVDSPPQLIDVRPIIIIICFRHY